MTTPSPAIIEDWSDNDSNPPPPEEEILAEAPIARFNSRNKKLSCGKSFTLMVTSKGEVMNLNVEPEPKKIEIEGGQSVIEVACGFGHYAVLFENGRVATMGDNGYGQLGHGDYIRREKLHLIESIENNNAVGIRCSFSSTHVIFDDGSVMACGENSFFQLGVTQHDFHSFVRQRRTYGPPHQHSLKPVDSFPVGVIDLSSSGFCTIFLLEDGTIYGCGQNKYNQLDTDIDSSSIIERRVPALIQGLEEGMPFSGVSCADYYAMACCHDGRVWIWGRGRISSVRISVSAAIPGINDCISVSAGDSSYAILHSDRRVTIWSNDKPSDQADEELTDVDAVEYGANGQLIIAVNLYNNKVQRVWK